MIRPLPLLVPLLALLAWPAGALTLDAMQGRWMGEGALTLGDEPPQRLRCQIRLNPVQPGESFFVGRCATAQAQQSFTYMIFEAADGTLRAENRAEGESELPPLMQGQSGPGLLRLQADSGASFELHHDGEVLVFTLTGTDSRGPARGEARLSPRE